MTSNKLIEIKDDAYLIIEALPNKEFADITSPGNNLVDRILSNINTLISESTSKYTEAELMDKVRESVGFHNASRETIRALIEMGVITVREDTQNV